MTRAGRAVVVGLMTAGLSLSGMGAASAVKDKECPAGPGNSGFTQEQRASCKASDSNEAPKGPVTNRGGGEPGGFN